MTAMFLNRNYIDPLHPTVREPNGRSAPSERLIDDDFRSV